MNDHVELFSSMSVTARVGLAGVLIVINAFFVAVEFALVRVRRTRLEELARDGSYRARDALGIHTQLDSYLSACQLGVTAASLGLGWVGEPAVAALLRPWLDPLLALGGAEVAGYAPVASFAIGFAIITALHIVVGEQAPKVLAISKAEALVLQSAFPMRLIHGLAWPAIWGLNSASNALCRAMGVDPATSHKEVHSGAELKMILNQSADQDGAMSRAEKDVVSRALDFSHRLVREVMVPRGEVAFLNTQRSMQANLQTVLESGFTRFPLCDGDLDHVRGMVHLRDLLEKRILPKVPTGAAPAEPELRSLARKPKYMPELLTLSNALKEFQRTRTHQAVVVDEYGGTVGLLTLEDVLEALVGPIQDEFDEETPLIQGMGKGMVRVDGSTPLAEVNQALGLTVQDPDNGTLGGHLTMLLGRLAQVGDRVRLGPYDVVVEQMNGLAVGQVSFVLRADKRPGGDDGSTPPPEDPRRRDKPGGPDPVAA
ncbi:MAG: HlyC/CorC family transporter [Deltaproteobacteria bacterium]|nr:HlyC/CorC family transporter [Deltaproteobacteria bacterium]